MFRGAPQVEFAFDGAPLDTSRFNSYERRYQAAAFFMCEAVQRRAFDASASSNDACRQGPLSSPLDEKGF